MERSQIMVDESQQVLPPDLFAIYDTHFWNDPQQNPNRVVVL
jgi:hypothetical protein